MLDGSDVVFQTKIMNEHLICSLCMGYLRDAYDETYAVPLLVSFAASALLQPFFYRLMVRDRDATQRARVMLV